MTKTVGIDELLEGRLVSSSGCRQINCAPSIRLGDSTAGKQQEEENHNGSH
jgi:hypothetical protein